MDKKNEENKKNKQIKKEIKKEEKKEEKMVSIPEKSLKQLMDEINVLKKDRDMLLEVADKKQLATYYQRNREKIPTKVKLRTYNGKVVLGWRSTKDIVQPHPAMPGRWVEDQRCELLFEDGTSSGEIYQTEFIRNYQQVDAEVIQKVVDEKTGNVALKVRRIDNGKEYTIGIQFIN